MHPPDPPHPDRWTTDRLRGRFRGRFQRWGRGGFTLIEALIAGVLLALIGVMIARGVTQSLAATTMSRDRQQAAAALDGIMTRIDTYGPGRLLREGLTEGVCQAPYQRFTWSADIQPMTEGDLYDVTVTVTWPTGHGPRRESLRTRLNDPTGSRDPNVHWSDL